jgi:hypothetical protein
MAEPALAGTGVAVAWPPLGNDNEAYVFYVGTSDNQIYNWYWDGSTWSNSVLGAGGQQAYFPGTGLIGMAAAWQPEATHPTLFYVGAGGPICSWYWDGSTWSNTVLGPGGMEAMSGTWVAAAWQPNGINANVFYQGGDLQIYNWYWDGSTWSNSVVGPGGELGLAGGLPTGVAAAWQPNGTNANVFYVGENSEIYNWWWDGSAWSNSWLGLGAQASAGTGLAVAWQPAPVHRFPIRELDLPFPFGHQGPANVFYAGEKGQIYTWYWDGRAWSNNNAPLGPGGAPAQDFSGVVAAWQPNGTEANVFYVGADGQIYNWWWNGSTWTNSALGTGGEPALSGGLDFSWQPNGTQANVFYAGADGQIYNWWWNGSAWYNCQLFESSTIG